MECRGLPHSHPEQVLQGLRQDNPLQRNPDLGLVLHHWALKDIPQVSRVDPEFMQHLYNLLTICEVLLFAGLESLDSLGDASLLEEVGHILELLLLLLREVIPHELYARLEVGVDGAFQFLLE